MTWGKDEDGSIYVIPIQQADGNWIRHADYAKLEAEVERLNLLTAEMDKTINISQAGCRLLKAEVESLHKAGDEMAKRTEFFQKRWDADELCQEVEAWNAAKEGKPSV
jgi:hypothetical protein